MDVIARESALHSAVSRLGINPDALGVAAELLDPRRLGSRGHLKIVLEEIESKTSKEVKKRQSLVGRLRCLEIKLDRLNTSSSKNIFARIFRALDKFFTQYSINRVTGSIQDSDDALEVINLGKEAIKCLSKLLVKAKVATKARRKIVDGKTVVVGELPDSFRLPRPLGTIAE